MNLRSNKGYAATDISISVIVLLLFVPVIMGIVYNVNKTKTESNIRTEALNIATNCIETSKGLDVDELTVESIDAELSGGIYSGKISEAQDNSDGSRNFVITGNNASYKVKVSIVDYKNQSDETKNDEDIYPNVVKTITVVVTYKYGNEEKSIDLSTVLK